MTNYIIRYVMNGAECEEIVPGINPIAAIVAFDDEWDVEGAGIKVLKVREVTDD